jgi:hypothetical protein
MVGLQDPTIATFKIINSDKLWKLGLIKTVHVTEEHVLDTNAGKQPP